MSYATHAANRCPRCGHPIDRCTNLDYAIPPRPGDLSVCLYCGAFLTFAGPELRIRELAPAEFQTLPEENKSELVLLQLTVRAARRTFARN